MREVVKGEIIPHATFKGHYSVMYRLIASCANFGSSAADTSVGGGITTSATVYYHPQLGNDANSGATALLPKQNLPFPLAGSTKHLVASGSTITLPQTFTGYPTVTNDNTVISVYDSNTRSPTFGQEILASENPFNRALLGSWVNEAERLARYFTIDGVDINNVFNNRGMQVGGASTNINVCIRGAWIKNARLAGIICRKTNVRIEDCVFENIQNGLVATEGYGGASIRAEDVACNTNIARCWISGTGEDAMWLFTAATHTIADTAIIHNAEKQIYGEQHCDVFQWGTDVTNFTVRRVIGWHHIKEIPLVPNPVETQSIGAFLMDTGTGTIRNGGLMEDVVYITNRQGTNFERRGTVTKNRCVEYMIINSTGNTDISTFQQAGNQVNNGVMCKQIGLPVNIEFNELLGAGAFTESNMRYYNLSSTE